MLVKKLKLWMVFYEIIIQDSDCEVAQEVEVHEDTLCSTYEGMEQLVVFVGPLYYLYYVEERHKYMEEEIQAAFGKEHYIECRKVYQDVHDLHRGNEIINECPIYITFRGERAIDCGGIQRDMFSSFWEAAYNMLFEGSNLLTPMIHPQTDLAVFPIVGRILSHGYLVTGILPVRIALPTLLCMLLGPASPISKELLFDTFLDFVSTEERKTMQQALAYKEKMSFQVIYREIWKMS